MKSNRWWLLGALALSLLLGAFIRLSKEDVRWFPPFIPARWRPLVTTVIGLAAGILSSVAGGVPILAAILGGLATGGLPVLGHEVIVNGLRNGRDFGEKKPPSPPSSEPGLPAVSIDDDTPPPPPIAAFIRGLHMPKLRLLTISLAIVAIGSLSGCASFGKDVKEASDVVAKDGPIVCAAIAPLVQSDMFDKLCGITEAVAPEVRDIAHQVFAARQQQHAAAMHCPGTDAGAPPATPPPS